MQAQQHMAEEMKTHKFHADLVVCTLPDFCTFGDCQGHVGKKDLAVGWRKNKKHSSDTLFSV